MKTRLLKVEHACINTPPQIRLKGKWLERYGFKPGNHVLLTPERPGLLSLRFVEARYTANP